MEQEEQSDCDKFVKSTTGGYVGISLMALSIIGFIVGGITYASAHWSPLRIKPKHIPVNEKTRTIGITILGLAAASLLTGVCLCVSVCKAGGFGDDEKRQSQETEGERRPDVEEGNRGTMQVSSRGAPGEHTMEPLLNQNRAVATAPTEPPPSYAECVR